MNIGDTVGICLDPKRRPFKVHGIRESQKFTHGGYEGDGKVMAITMKAWGVLFVAQVPESRLEILEAK